MKKIMSIMAVAMLCLLFKAEAQSSKINIQRLNVGDIVPDEVWNFPLKVINHPEGKEIITLKEYKGKLIILDFWATWCGSCIYAMPEMHKLQQQFKDNLMILPVGYETKQKIETCLKTNATLVPLNLTSTYADSLLKRVFPHRLLPHNTWISPDGRVIAETLSEDATIENVKLALNNVSPPVNIKIDLDDRKPVFLRNDLVANLELKHYSILLKGYYAGLGSGQSELRNEKDVLIGKTITNLPLYNVYRNVASNLFKLQKDRFDEKRLVIDVRDKSQLVRDYAQPDSLFPKSNYYTYCLTMPPDEIQNLYSYMLEDLNKYSGYYGKIEKRKTRCMVLRRTSKKDKIKTKGGKSSCTLFREPRSIFQNLPSSLLAGYIDALDFIKLSVLDETNYLTNVDIELSGNPDMPTLQKELKAFDLELVEATREINFFVITDK